MKLILEKAVEITQVKIIYDLRYTMDAPVDDSLVNRKSNIVNHHSGLLACWPALALGLALCALPVSGQTLDENLKPKTPPPRTGKAKLDTRAAPASHPRTRSR